MPKINMAISEEELKELIETPKGDKEEENNTLAVRKRGEKPKFGISADSLIQELKKELEGPKGLLR